MTKFGYFFAQTHKRSGYVTVAINRPDKDDPNQKHFASFSFCSPKDCFSKTLGRKIAENRLNANKCIEIMVSGTVPMVITTAMESAIAQGLVPSWVIKAQKRKKLHYGLNHHSSEGAPKVKASNLEGS
jgi:hypothetical protein